MSAPIQTRYKLDPIEPTETIESRVYTQLRQAIVEGTLVPGQRLVLTRLAVDLGVSRVPITQALKRLEVQGFVNTGERNEFVVVTLTAEDVWEIYTLRASLQPLAARLAAKRARPEQLAKIERISDEVERLVSGGEPVNDRYFHVAVAEASNMPRLCQMLVDLWDHSEVYRAALDAEYRKLEQERKGQEQAYSTREHIDLVAAIMRGDGDAAAAAEERQVRRSMERVLALPVITSGR